MAEEAQIKIAQEKLGPDAAAGGWTELRVGEDLDLGLTPNQIALAWWEHRAASTATYTDVQESGSSRALSTIHKQAVAMADRYQKLVNLEDPTDNVDDPPLTRGPGIRTFPIRRIAR